MIVHEQFKRVFKKYINGNDIEALEWIILNMDTLDWVDWLIQLKAINTIIEQSEWALYMIGAHCNKRDFAGNAWDWLVKIKESEIDSLVEYYQNECPITKFSFENALFRQDIGVVLN